MQQQPLTLGIAGLGTVGAGLLHLLEHHKDRLEERAGRQIRIAGSLGARKRKKRGVETEGLTWFDDPVTLASDPSIDVFVELIGGSDGVGQRRGRGRAAAGKHVVTANKALLAEHGIALAKLAEEHSVALNFEAAVAGGIPVIKTLREVARANEMRRVYGILNGTCNYILTTMADEHRSFDDVLKEAQARGYAEADPTFDIGGFDTAHKLAILTSLAFGTKIAFDQIHVEGIQSHQRGRHRGRRRHGLPHQAAGRRHAHRERHRGARQSGDGAQEFGDRARSSGVTNAVAIDGDYCGSLLLIGPGAGRQRDGLVGRRRHPRHRARQHHAAVRHARPAI